MKVTALKPGYFGKLKRAGRRVRRTGWREGVLVRAPASGPARAACQQAPKPPLTSTCKEFDDKSGGDLV